MIRKRGSLYMDSSKNSQVTAAARVTVVAESIFVHSSILQGHVLVGGSYEL